MKASPVKLGAAVIAAVTMAFSVTDAQEQCVNFQFRVSGTATAYGGQNSKQYSGTGVAVDSGTYWNQVVFTSVATTGMVYTPFTAKQSDGLTASNITLSFTPSSTGTVGMYARADVSGTSNFLMDSYLYAKKSSTIGLTIGGLVAGQEYDLFLYSQNAAYDSDTSQFTPVIDGTLGSPLYVNNHKTVFPPFSYQSGANYCEMALIASEAGTISINLTGTNSLGEGAFNGFQIYSAVPEPGSTALAITGGVGMLFFLRRNITRKGTTK